MKRNTQELVDTGLTPTEMIEVLTAFIQNQPIQILVFGVWENCDYGTPGFNFKDNIYRVAPKESV